MLMAFEVYYVGFGQAIASFSPNELLASILVPVFFLFVVSFCGIVVPFAVLPEVSLGLMFGPGSGMRINLSLSFGGHGCTI